MSKIITLKDRITQESMYPITTTSAVLDGNGKSIETILTEKSEELELKAVDAMLQARAAMDSITSLSNLSNTSEAQEELDKIKTQVETNKSGINTLKSNYTTLKELTNNVVKTEDLVNTIESGSSQIPTTAAVESYVSKKSADLMSYVIDTTTVTPNYIPRKSGQVLVNTENNLIYFSPGGSTVWFALEATPIELPEAVLEGYINGDNLELIGDVFVEQDTLVIGGGGEIENDTLVISGTSGISTNGSVENKTLSVNENSNGISVSGSTLNLGNMSVDNGTLSI